MVRKTRDEEYSTSRRNSNASSQKSTPPYSATGPKGWEIINKGGQKRGERTCYDAVAHGRRLAPRLEVEVALVDQEERLPPGRHGKGVLDGDAAPAVTVHGSRPADLSILELVGDLAQVEDIDRHLEYFRDFVGWLAKCTGNFLCPEGSGEGGLNNEPDSAVRVFPTPGGPVRETTSPLPLPWTTSPAGCWPPPTWVSTKDRTRSLYPSGSTSVLNGSGFHSTSRIPST